MQDFAMLVQQGAGNLWVFIPSAILLGALHGLEPGHSKTMMAAFIISVRGTVGQAVLLGLCAAASHTLIVWSVALGGMYLWQGVNAETTEPYFQLFSGAIIIGISFWMLRRTWRDGQRAKLESGHAHGGRRHVDTGHGAVSIEIFEEGVPPRWRVRTENGHTWAAQDVSLEIERPDGSRQDFLFCAQDGYLESNEAIPEPHEFMARLRYNHDGHSHDYDISFIEHDEGHDHIHEELRGLETSTGGYRDAHELAHANDIRRRFADRKVTTWQIALFGLTGGLIPCPAAITVLLLCLQLKEVALGATLVLSFSIGLAVTLVVVGAAAALSVHYATKRHAWFGAVARKAPYFSGGLMLAIGLYMAAHGWGGM